MKRIKGKLQSKRGASITFALLLFLVCAVVSSVVIVAATTAAGRMAKNAETDQRYYAVTSAARLLKDALENHSVEVIEVSTTITTSVTDIDAEDPTPSITTVGPETVTQYVVDREPLEAITEFTLYTDAALKAVEYDKNGSVTDPFVRTLDLAVGDNAVLSVKIEETLYKNGSIRFVAYNDTTTADDKGVYKVAMTFGGKVEHGITIREEAPKVETDNTAGTYTVERTNIKTETWTCSWELTDVEERIAAAKKDSD